MEKTKLILLKQAQEIANEIWDTYDDTHGYATEKKEINNSTSIDNPDNIYFFTGQFDHINQIKLWNRAVEKGYEELANFIFYKILSPMLEELLK